MMAALQGHYSLTKGAALLGLGEDNVVKVTTDAAGRMRADALDSELTRLKSQVLRSLVIIIISSLGIGTGADCGLWTRIQTRTEISHQYVSYISN